MKAEPKDGIETVEALVVGSGFGGAATACRLAQANFDVMILERGRRYEAGDVPELPSKEQLLPDMRRWTWQPNQGLWDVADLDELISVQAAAYGGGSLIYANVHLRPPAEVFNDVWPEVYQGGAVLKEYYDLAASMLDVAPVSVNDRLSRSLVKTHQLEQAAKRLARENAFFLPPLAINHRDGENQHGQRQSACNGCGACCTGCPIRAKNTLDLNYLAVAEKHGARVRTQWEVLGITERPDSEHRWELECIDHLEARARTLRSKYLFLCAGSIHTTRLLATAEVSNQEALRRMVGIGYFPGADAVGVVYDTKNEQQPSVGPAITSAIVHRDGERSFFMLQDGGYPAELERVIGLLRSGLWLGRNRLSRVGQSSVEPCDVRSEAVRTGLTGGLGSALDDVAAAMKDGSFHGSSPEGLLKGIEAVLSEFRRPAMLDMLIDATLDAAVKRKIDGNPFSRRLGADHPLVRAAHVIGRDLLGKLLDGGEGISADVVRALTEHAGLTLDQVLERVLGYDAAGASRRTMLLAMGFDSATGQLTVKNGKLTCDLDLYDLATGYAKEEQLMTDVAASLGGELRVNPAWAILGKPITVHSQGGCPMSTKASQGVVDPDGKVHGHEGLYVMDGSVLCHSVGVNPSATILAVVERNILRFVQSKRGQQWPEAFKDAGAREYVQHRKRAVEWAQKAADKGWVLSPPNGTPVDLKSKRLGIAFHEEMTGYVSATDIRPDTAEEHYVLESRGRGRRGLARLRLDVSQQNLAQFFHDPKHVLELSGFVDICLPGDADVKEHAVSGKLSLFAPLCKPNAIVDPVRLAAQKHLAGDYRVLAKPEPRSLSYELDFDNRPGWSLHGFKELREQPALAAWRDATTLFVTLEGPTSGNGHSRNGARRVHAAGVVRVPLFDFLNVQIPSLRATGTEDDARKIWAVTKFANYFFGTLQSIQAPQLSQAIKALARGDRRLDQVSAP